MKVQIKTTNNKIKNLILSQEEYNKVIDRLNGPVPSVNLLSDEGELVEINSLSSILRELPPESFFRAFKINGNLAFLYTTGITIRYKINSDKVTLAIAKIDDGKYHLYEVTTGNEVYKDKKFNTEKEALSFISPKLIQKIYTALQGPLYQPIKDKIQKMSAELKSA